MMEISEQIDHLRAELGTIVMQIERHRSPTILASLFDRGRGVALLLAEARAAEHAATGKAEEAAIWLAERKHALATATHDVMDVILTAEAYGGRLR